MAEAGGIHAPAFDGRSLGLYRDGCAFVAPRIVVLGPSLELHSHGFEVVIKCIVPRAVGINLVGRPLARVGSCLPVGVADGSLAAVLLFVAFLYL